MYVPGAFTVTDPDQIEAVLARAPLACLVTSGRDGLYASHLPMKYDRERSVLAGHLARANPHRDEAGDSEALIVFQGPSAYVSPAWYPGKAEHGRVVPTWNYEVAHVYGTLTWIDDTVWLRDLIAVLSDRFEASEPQPWAVADAPQSFIKGLTGAIVGLELKITRIEAKRKLSQNRGEADRRGVIAGLQRRATGDDAMIAALMREDLP